MARSFGKIETAFWQNPKVRRLSDDARLLLLYVFTSQHSTGASAYILPMGYVTEDLGWDDARVTKTFHELSLKPYVLRDPKTNLIFVPGWWAHNKPENPKVAGFVVKQLLALPDCQIKIQAIQGLIDSKYRETAVLEAVGNWKPEVKQGGLDLAGTHGQRELLPAHDVKASPAKAKSSGTRLTADWRAPAEYRDYAARKNISQERIDQIEVRFARYWTGPDASDPVKKDWFRTWQNWVDKESERKSTNGNGAHMNGGAEHVVIAGPDWDMREKGLKERGIWLASWGPKPDEPGYEGKRKKVPPPPV